MARKKKKKEKEIELILPTLIIELANMLNGDVEKTYRIDGYSANLLASAITGDGKSDILNNFEYGINLLLRSPQSMVIDSREEVECLLFALINHSGKILRSYGITDDDCLSTKFPDRVRRILGASYILIQALRDYFEGTYQVILFSEIMTTDEVL